MESDFDGWVQGRFFEKNALKNRNTLVQVAFFPEFFSCRVSEWVVGPGNIGFRQKSNFRQLDGFWLTKKPSKDTLMKI